MSVSRIEVTTTSAPILGLDPGRVSVMVRNADKVTDLYLGDSKDRLDKGHYWTVEPGEVFADNAADPKVDGCGYELWAKSATGTIVAEIIVKERIR